jgi:mono/diheme cytochrome c family protein
MKTSLYFSAAAALSIVTVTSSAFAADAAKGAPLYAQRCAMCHGDKGHGDGPLAATMPEGQKPRNLSAGGYKYATDDAKFKELLQKGGAGVGLSVLMPGQADLKDADIENVIAYVKTLK